MPKLYSRRPKQHSPPDFLIILALLTLSATFLFAAPDNPTGLDSTDRDFKILIIDAQQGEPYESFRLAMLDELDRLGYILNDNLHIQYYSLGNQASLAQRIWQIEDCTAYNAVVLNGTIAAMAFIELFQRDTAAGLLPKKNGDQCHFFFGNQTDPISTGLIQAFYQAPYSQFTGVAYPVPPAERLRLIRQLLPEVRTIGLVYTSMPQSLDYNEHLRQALKEPDLADIQVIFREIPFVPGEFGYRRSIQLAWQHILELDPQVDAFLSPMDQMGIQEEYVRMVSNNAQSPLFGISKLEISEGWGSLMSSYTSTHEAGHLLAGMLHQFLQGEAFDQIYPGLPETKLCINPSVAERLGITIPPELLARAQDNSKDE
ncbi:MAG: hypothetical protein D6B26_03895 [Spirochaetaceae bacterium]|nr:MAG: hypothetical protein D6B26_03895 [Spirochaetaceae bacterium]